MNRSTESVTELARALATVIPQVPTRLQSDGVAQHQWQNVMLEAAHGIAAAVGHDLDLLRAAIGPTIEVGTNPPWRALLEVALIVSTPAAQTTAYAVPLRLASSRA